MFLVTSKGLKCPGEAVGQEEGMLGLAVLNCKGRV